jgi:LPS O-antigen subunit length determinant protein (WzzB/FepE family)
MKKNKINKNLDLDLIELFQVAWNGKWIISAIMVVSLIISVGYYNKKNAAQLNYFTSEIDFLKINNQEAGRYSNYNSLITYKATESELRPSEFLEINPQVLFELYLEVIQDKQIFKDAIKNSEMINKKNYPSEEEFNTAINEKVSSIIIYSPDIIKKKYIENDKIKLNWRINFFHNNEAEWMRVFEEANKLTNEKVIEIIKTRFKH